MDAVICLAIDEPEVAERVGAALTGFGHRTLDCGRSKCPANVTAIVTDRAPSPSCRRGAECPVAGRGQFTNTCVVPVVRLASIETSTDPEAAFATLPEECPDEQLLIAVTRAVRYREHLKTMRELRRPARP